MKTKLFLKAFSISLLTIVTLSSPLVSAEQTALSPYSWDPGLYATAGRYNDTAHAWGKRATPGAWGTGSVNYQSGSTTSYRANSSGTLETVMRGTYCPGGACAYGSGSGYKGLVQFWNDPGNFIAFGLIKDPGVSPNGTTLMIEGAANGKPVGGYWGANGISGASHTWSFSWQSDRITVTIDNKVTLGPYLISMNNPSISFLAAGRNTGDIADTTFDGITFSPGSVVSQGVYVPSGSAYATYSATLNEGGSGTGTPPISICTMPAIMPLPSAFRVTLPHRSRTDSRGLSGNEYKMACLPMII